MREADKWHFAYVLPGNTSQSTRLVIPHALQMGWTQFLIRRFLTNVLSVDRLLVNLHEDCQPTTMVEKQRPRSGSRFSLNPLTAAVLDAIPPLGYKRPPPLIGVKTVSTAHRVLRAKNYAQANKTITIQDWNAYIAFGIQQFDSPAKYFAQCDAETPDEKNLRLARYYRLHLENNVQAERHLMIKINTVKAALKVSYPGYFEMSVGEMDEYACQLSPNPLELESQIMSEDMTDDIMDVVLATQDISYSPAATSRASKGSSVTSPSKSGILNVSPTKVTRPLSPMVADTAINNASATHTVKRTVQASHLTPTSTVQEILTISTLQLQGGDLAKNISDEPVTAISDDIPSTPPRPSTSHSKASMSPLNTTTTVLNALRVEVRWSPKDFFTLKASKALMYTRFDPILSGFNNSHSRVIEWQTDQMSQTSIISPTQVDKFLSVRCVASSKQKCFYFSFRIHATGPQFIQVLRSKEFQAIRNGKGISFNPSVIPPTQGEITHVGDILLKDATATHRGKYLKYLRSEVLPKDMPVYDLKIRHKDPSGRKTQILTVRCGKQVSTEVAQILSTFLNGEGTNPEIFISRLALGANRTARGDHDRIYQVHHDFMADVVYLPFLSSKQIDFPIIEHLDSGEQLTRTPRQWAKSLLDSDGQSLEVDMENGYAEGEVVLILPSASLEAATMELQKYCHRQNPILMKAERFYSASVLADPGIPLTVFTKNIDTILAKKIKRSIPSSASASPLSRDSLITGLTSKTSKSSIAWQIPLQSSVPKFSDNTKHASQAEGKKTTPPEPTASVREIAQQRRIAALEAQLASMSDGNSRASGDKSQLSGNSPNSLATAHARLDGIESVVLNIQTLLTNMSTTNQTTHEPPLSPSKSWPTMPRKQLFSDPDQGSQLVLLSSGTPPPASVRQKASKRKKTPTSPSLSSPSDLIPPCNEYMDTGGEESL